MIFPDFIDPKSKFERLYYIKLAWDSAWGLFSSPISVVGNIVALLTFLKVFNLYKPVIIIPLIIFFVFGFVTVGLYLLKKGYVTRTISIGNRYNEELQRILRGVEK